MTYGKGDPACGLLGTDGDYYGHKVVYSDVSNAASLIKLIKRYRRKIYVFVDEVEKVLEKPLFTYSAGAG